MKWREGGMDGEEWGGKERIGVHIRVMELSSAPCSKVGCSRHNYYYNSNECLSSPHTATISYHITSYLPPQLGFQNVISKLITAIHTCSIRHSSD